MGKKEVLNLVDTFGPDILLVPGRLGDGATLSPGMEGVTFKARPHPTRATPLYTHDSLRIAFRPEYVGLAIVMATVEAANAKGIKKVGGVHVDAQQDGSPFICPIINHPSRLLSMEGTVHAVSSEGWRPDWRTYQPNLYGFMLKESVEWHHDNPANVQILGSAVCGLLDAQIPIANVQNVDPSAIFYWPQATGGQAA